MSQPTGFARPASLAQRFWSDLLTSVRGSGRAVVGRRLDLGAVEAARAEASPTVRW